MLDSRRRAAPVPRIARILCHLGQGDRERPAPSIKPIVDMRTAAAVLHQARQLDEFRRGVNEHFAPDRWPNPNRTQVVSTAP